ncbi:hypothetical protein TRVL_00007 [Trypanosoma vivax]|nr:hypothetical protein TRVL_00007 [Trypanosoma vivax]
MPVCPRVDKPKAKTPYDIPERVRWYHILWEMRNNEFRVTYLKLQRRQWRLFWKYESHLVYERVLLGFGAATAVFLMSHMNIVKALVRLPTEDVNELLKQDVWRSYRSEINERKEHASKILEESSYVRERNKPYSN